MVCGLSAGGRWIRTFGSARKGRPISAFAFVYVPETVRVLSQRSTLLGAGGSKSRSRQADGANSRSLENVLASAERPDGASGTESSNPSPSSGESSANLTFGGSSRGAIRFRAASPPRAVSSQNYRFESDRPRKESLRLIYRGQSGIALRLPQHRSVRERPFGSRPPNGSIRPFSVTQLRISNGSSCPLSDLRADRFERLSRVEIRHSFRRPEAAHSRDRRGTVNLGSAD